MTRSRFVGALVALVALSASALVALADDYPSHPITMLVGFPPGGPTDTLARILADAMGRTLGQTVVVETVSGASGTIATGRVVHASPDGYTIGIGNWTSHVGSPAIYSLDYDILKDLQPISLLGEFAAVDRRQKRLAAEDRGRADRLGEVAIRIRSHSAPSAPAARRICAASSSRKKTGAHFQYVPYRGARAGDAGFDRRPDRPVVPRSVGRRCRMCRRADSRPLPSWANKRWPKSPDTPTMIESGVPGSVISFWHGLWTTKGTPQPIVDRLDAAVMAALADPAVRQRIEVLGQVIFPADQQNPAALAAYHKAELDKWWPIIKAAGIKASNSRATASQHAAL